MDREYCPYCMNPVEPGEPCPACGLTAGAYAPSPHHLPPGTILRERYLVGRVLGEGGFGITYIGCDLRLELKVAIKEYFPTDRANRVAAADLSVSSYSGAAGERYETGKARFLQEARTMARMDKQPVIVSVRDFFELNNTAYIVMEYVEGTTFKELVPQRGGRIPAGELLHEMEPLFTALNAMHRQGLIHRDISPENLMLENGDVRLLDFGCARESAGGEATLTIALKHGYAPVEQYQNKGQGPWTDVYALSATMYYCLTGRKPPQSMDRLVDDELVPPRKLGVEFTVRQEKALLYGMGVRPRRRFQSVEELHAALYEGVLPEGLELPEARPGPEPEPQPEPEPAPDNLMETKLHTPAHEAVAQDEPDPTQPGPEPEPRPEPGPREEAGILARLKAHWQIAAGAGAALVLLVVLLAWRPWTGAPDPDPPPAGSQPAAPASQSPSQTPEPVDLTFSQDKGGDENGAVLLALLADDSVEEITIPANVEAVVDEPVELHKTLVVRAQSNVSFARGLTVGQGGRVQTWGDVNMDGGMLRTMDGGAVSVESGGSVYPGGLLWLEGEGDLTCAPDASANIWGQWDPTKGPADDLYAYSHYMILDEEALFANAVQVSSGEEFAAACRGDTPIVVSGEITLPEYCDATVPVLIPEGAALNAPCDDNGDCTLDVDCTILVNRGALRGRVSMVDFSVDRMQANPRLVNYGTIEAELNALSGNAATLVNYGRIDFSGAPRLEQTAGCNLGRMVVPQGVTLRQVGNHFSNAQYICVSGGLWELSAHMVNNGSITVEQEGRVAVRVELSTGRGGISVSSGSLVENDGVMRVDGVFTLYRGAAFHNDGLLFHRSDALNFALEAPVSGEGHIIPFSWYETQGETVRHVSSERELRQALANPAVATIIWQGHQEGGYVHIEGGELTIDKTVVLNGPMGGQYGFSGVDITVTGENGLLITDQTGFGGSSLRVENGGSVLLDGDTPGLGGVTVDSGGLLASKTQTTVTGPVAVTGGGRLTEIGGLEPSGGLTIDGESELVSCNWLGLKGCAVVNDGTLSVLGSIDQEGGSLTNNGQMTLGQYGRIWLGGSVSNHGEMRFTSGGELEGRLVNEEDGVIVIEGGGQDNCPVVRGTLDNQGVIRAPNGGDLYADGGRITGNLVQYE